MGAIDTAAKILDECVTRIRANMAKHYRSRFGERWVNASGRSSEAFKVEVDGGTVRLVYRGDDVAPLETIQHGTTGVPPISVIARWQEEKGLTEMNPWAIRTNIKKRGGTERHVEPQEWIIAPEVERAAQELREQLAQAVVGEINAKLFRN